ncbi:MAG TPA: hypothetical protein VFB20_15175 [Burkholderiales bacterium]|nr:hypothetical protein [Burkholderiales bacterium]
MNAFKTAACAALILAAGSAWAAELIAPEPNVSKVEGRSAANLKTSSADAVWSDALKWDKVWGPEAPIASDPAASGQAVRSASDRNANDVMGRSS